MNEQTKLSQMSADADKNVTANDAGNAPAKAPFVLPKLTHHGRVAAVTQKNLYAPLFQEMIVAETSP